MRSTGKHIEMRFPVPSCFSSEEYSWGMAAIVSMKVDNPAYEEIENRISNFTRQHISSMLAALEDKSSNRSFTGG
jgi:hypothetical protein